MKKLIFVVCIILLFIACDKDPEATYTVIYHSDGSTSGYPPVDNNRYTSGSYATVLGQHTLLKTGHEFGGWNTKSDYSGDHYNSGNKIEVKNIDIFLFPVWNLEH